MNSQLESSVSGLRRGHLELLQGGRVLPLGDSGGKLEVLHGRVWLTRAGEDDDDRGDRTPRSRCQDPRRTTPTRRRRR